MQVQELLALYGVAILCHHLCTASLATARRLRESRSPDISCGSLESWGTWLRGALTPGLWTEDVGVRGESLLQPWH